MIFLSIWELVRYQPHLCHGQCCSVSWYGFKIILNAKIWPFVHFEVSWFWLLDEFSKENADYSVCSPPVFFSQVTICSLLLTQSLQVVDVAWIARLLRSHSEDSQFSIQYRYRHLHMIVYIETIYFFLPKKSLKSRRVFCYEAWLELEKNCLTFNHALQKSSKSIAVYPFGPTGMFRSNIFLPTLKMTTTWPRHALSICPNTSCVVSFWHTWSWLPGFSSSDYLWRTCQCLKRRLFLNMTFSEFSI